MKTSRESERRCGQCGGRNAGAHCIHCGFEGCWECALECAYSHQITTGVELDVAASKGQWFNDPQFHTDGRGVNHA